MTGLRPVWRMLIVWLVAAGPCSSSPGCCPGSPSTAPVGVRRRGAARPANALVWPVLVRLALPLTVLTLGLAAAGAERGLVGPRGAALRRRPSGRVLVGGRGHRQGVTAVSMSLTGLLALDDDAVVLRHLTRSPALHARRPGRDDRRRGWCSCRSTGWRCPSCSERSATGTRPTLAGWLREGTHGSLRGTPTGARRPAPARRHPARLATTTSSAFRWYEKDTRPAWSCRTDRDDAAEIERRHVRRRAGCSPATAPAAATSSPATPRTRCLR